MEKIGIVSEATVDLTEDIVIICHSIFCGKDSGITIYSHPNNAPKWLPEKPDLTDNERILLECTKGLKSSYAGIKDYRYHEAKRKGFNGDIDKVRASLREKGLLNKRNAITDKGRNAIND